MIERYAVKHVNYGIKRMWDQSEAYREICKAQGFNEMPQIRRIDEIPKKVPVLTQSHLAEYDERLWAGNIGSVHWTSGTKRRKRIPKTKEDWSYLTENISTMLRGEFKEGDKILNTFPAGTWIAYLMGWMGGYGAMPYLRILNCNGLTDPMLPKILEVEGITGSFMFSRGAVLLGEKIGDKYERMKRILISGEPSSIERKKKIMNLWSGLERIIDVYACSELGIVGVPATENFDAPFRCFEDYVLVQVVDENNELVDEGETGAIRLTAVTEYGLSIYYANYEIGDKARVLELGNGYTTLFDRIDRLGDEAFVGASEISRYHLEEALYSLNDPRLSTDNYDAIIWESKPGVTTAVIELEAQTQLNPEEAQALANAYLSKLFEINPTVASEVKLGAADVIVKIRERGQQLAFMRIPGKPRRIIKRDLLEKFNIDLEEIIQ